MHPPFIFTNHKVGPNPHHISDVKHIRRGVPQRLDLRPVTTGWPPVPLIAPAPTLPLAPSGQPLLRGVRLQVVPPPRNNLRDIIGRWLIRAGQRMILQNRPG